MEAAVEVASNLRTDDYREVWEGHGHFPRWYIPFAAFMYRKVEKYGCYAPQLYMNIHSLLHEKLNDS